MYKHIRQIFSVFALVMLAVLISRWWADAWTWVNWAMLAISAVVCLLVFRVFLYIFNFSYALAAILNSLLIIVAMPSVVSFLLGGLMIGYGVRLFRFSWQRTNSVSYAPRVRNVRKADKQMPVGIKAALWVQCTLLYTFHLFGIYLAAEREAVTGTVVLGALFILAGIVIEAVADAQKQNAKAVDPDRFVEEGLFRNWRHPNYTGEIIVQVGLIIVGIGAAAATWGNQIAVVVAPLYIILLMVAECARADAEMEERYGLDPRFKRWWQNSGTYLPKL